MDIISKDLCVLILKQRYSMSPLLIICHFFVIDFIYQIFNNPEEPFILHRNISIFIYIQELSFYTREIGHETKLSFSIVHA